MRVAHVRTSPRVSLGTARSAGIGVSFVVPRGARLIQARLQRGGRTLFSRTVRAARPGSRQTVQLRGARLSRILHDGRYVVALSAGRARGLLDAPVRRGVSIG
jgi:hypothetical protein